MRRDEEQNLSRVLRHEFALEHVANDRNAGHARRALSLRGFRIGKHATHHGGAAIRNQHFRLHALGVDAGNATDGDTGIDGVVFDRHAQDNGACIRDLRSDGETQRN